MNEGTIRYGFLPWLRQGLSAQINEEDTLGVNGGGKVGRPTVEVRLKLAGTKVNENTVAHIAEDVTKDVDLIGPGDITGIKSAAIVKTEPLASVATFEPNYFPYIEFYEEDFPWRYTPAKANVDGRLRPWLVLVVLDESEFERRFFPGAPLATIAPKGNQSIPFPPKEETWAWAHVQVNRPLDSNNSIASELEAVVKDNPNLASARLICPRRLKANTSYTAFLLPAFEQGRLAGLGASNELIQQTENQICSWEEHASNEFANLWPVYFEWDFRTGDLADFESLVRRIEARVLESPIGRRPMDLQNAGYELSYNGGDGSLLLEGALQIVGATQPGNRFDFLGGGNQENEFIDGLQTLLNLNAELESGTADLNPLNQTMYTSDGGNDDPIITPPLYGQWHANQFAADADDPVFWFNELNLDPRNRVASGLGTQVVRKNQDTYMDRAWDQAGAILEARRRIRLDRFAAANSRKLRSAYFERMDDASFSAFSSSFHNRSQYVENGMATNTTVLAEVRKRLVKPANLKELEDNNKENLLEAQSDLETKLAEKASQEQAITNKQAEIADIEKVIVDLNAAIQQLNDEISDLNDLIAAKEGEIIATKNEVQNELIPEIEGQLIALEGQLEVLMEDPDDNELAIEATEKVIEAKKEQLEELPKIPNLLDEIAVETDEDQIASKENAIKNLITLQKGSEDPVIEAQAIEWDTLITERDELRSQRADKESELNAKNNELAQAEIDLLAKENELEDLLIEKQQIENAINTIRETIQKINNILIGLTRLFLPSSAIKQDYRKIARTNSPIFRHIGNGGTATKAPLKQLNEELDNIDTESIPESFNTKGWTELNWGAALFTEPPLEAPEEDIPETTTPPIIASSVGGNIKTGLTKSKTASFTINSVGAPEEEGATPKQLITYPEFKEATYAALAEISADLVLPNIQLIPMDTFSLLEVNQRFIESYLVGLNHEMARELLWREFPTDQRGSYFRRFWDDLDNLAATDPLPDINLLTKLSEPLGQNFAPDGKIKPEDLDPDNPNVVFVIRSELLKKFPNALVFMQKAKPGEENQRTLTTGKGDDERKMPVFKASIYPDVTFYGFNISVEASKGDEGDPGWFFVIQERPGEPRFGMDITTEQEGQNPEDIKEWNDLAWPLLQVQENGFFQLSGQSVPSELPPKEGAIGNYTWGMNGGHMAGILLQLPFMVAVHATDMIKLND